MREKRAEDVVGGLDPTQQIKDLGTGLAGRRREAQLEGKKFAQLLTAPTAAQPNNGFIAIQAREQWSSTEEAHYRPGHFWLAQASAVLEVRCIDTRCTIEGVMFGIGDYLVRIGRYFDRVASDPSALTFEEWTPPDGSSFIVNATEIRGVNFTMTPLSPIQSVEIRRSGRRPAVVQVPAFSLAQLPKQYQMDPLIDDTIRARCW